MDVQIFNPEKGFDFVAALGLCANISAVAATSAIAMWSINENRSLRRQARTEALQIAYVGLRHTLQLTRVLFDGLEKATPKGPADHSLALAILIPAKVAVDRVISKDIPNGEMFNFAINTQLAIAALIRDVENRSRARETNEAFRFSMRELDMAMLNAVEGLEEIREHLGIASPLIRRGGGFADQFKV